MSGMEAVGMFFNTVQVAAIVVVGAYGAFSVFAGRKIESQTLQQWEMRSSSWPSA